MLGLRHMSQWWPSAHRRTPTFRKSMAISFSTSVTIYLEWWCLNYTSMTCRRSINTISTHPAANPNFRVRVKLGLRAIDHHRTPRIRPYMFFVFFSYFIIFMKPWCLNEYCVASVTILSSPRWLGTCASFQSHRSDIDVFFSSLPLGSVRSDGPNIE